jgi:ABC-type sulfate/molybdate transport systems ATPase subunit
MLEVSVVKKLRDYTMDMSFSVSPGETLVLMGENGAGKTMLLNMIAGLATPEAGQIRLDDTCFFDRASGRDMPPEYRNVGYLFQNYALFPTMTVYDNVAFGMRMQKKPRAEIKPKVRQLLEEMGMWELHGERVVKLSGGQKQRVALSRALAIDPALFLLDEPLSAIDAEAQLSLRKELKRIIKGAGVPGIIVTHSIKDAHELADRVCLMEKGKMIASGKPEDVLRKGTSRFTDGIIDAY